MLGYYHMSLIGTSHQAKGGVCQDFSDVKTLPNGWVVAAAADGMGSAVHSEIGARIAVETLIAFVEAHLPEKWHRVSLLSLLQVAYQEAYRAVRKKADEEKNEVSDYDTTLMAVLYNGVNVVYGYVGDGGIIALSPYGEFSLLTEAQKGDAFNETTPLRAGAESWIFGTSEDDVCALLMMTDGIYDIAVPWLLAKTDQKIWINYIRSFLDRNVLRVSTQEDFAAAANEIEKYFTGPESGQITDDKTILGIINTDVTPEVQEESYYREPDWDGLAKAHRDKLYGSRQETAENVMKRESQGKQSQEAVEAQSQGTQGQEAVEAKSQGTQGQEAVEVLAQGTRKSVSVQSQPPRNPADKGAGRFGRIADLWDLFFHRSRKDENGN